MPVIHKNSYIRIRCTEGLKTRLEDIADAENISVSRLIRDVLYQAVKYRETKAERAANNEPREERFDD